MPTAALADEVQEVSRTQIGETSTYWELSSDGTLKISGSGAMADYMSTSGQPWNTYAKDITSVEIGTEITHIGGCAFQGFSSLESIEIPGSVTSLGKQVFKNCSALKEVTFSGSITSMGNSVFQGTAIETISLPEGLITIGDGLFYSCQSLKEVSLPNSLSAMGNNTFYQNKALTSVKIGNGLDVIPQNTFYQCESLEKIEIPSNIREIEETAFIESGLTEITFQTGSLIKIGKQAFCKCPLTSVDLPSGLETLDTYAFQYCEDLTAIALPSTLKTIGYGAFYECKSLPEIEIPDSVESIGESAFYNCEALGVISLPAALMELKNIKLDTCDTLRVVDLSKVSKATSVPDASLENSAVKVIYVSNALENGITEKTYNKNTTALAFMKGGTFEGALTGNMSDHPAKVNFTFAGWSTNPDAQAGDQSGDFSGNQSYYAIWAPCDHVPNADDGDCTTAITCSKCGAVTTAAQNHEWSDWVVTQAPTYDASGEKTHSCIHENCEVTETETIPKLTRPSSGGSGSASTPTYTVTADSAKNGAVTVSPKSAKKGDTVTITVKPDDGYELNELTVTDKNGKTVKVTEGKNGKFTFTMPATKVTVEATFSKIEEAQTFIDVPDGYWAEDAIAWAAENGYMNGNSAVTFNPEGTVTRQQLWMILARLSGYQPADFTEAKAWAVDNGVSDGTVPGNAVSRQQLVTILYRYAVRMGYNTAARADLTVFPDHASVASYATDAMSWSVANGIVGGTTQGTLNPAGTATRAQFAVILSRFVG